MLREIINNTDIDDELFYSDEVEKSKLILDLRIITERYRNEVKDRILTCIEICSTDTFDNKKTINEILLLLTDEVIIENMDSVDIASLYQNLWENYFLMWEFEETLKCYKKSFSLWNKKIYEKLIKFLNSESEYVQWVELTDLISSVNKKKIVWMCVCTSSEF